MPLLRILLSALFVATLVQSAMPADKPAIGKLVVEKAWARASVVRNGAAYITIRNDGDAPDRLIGVSTPVARSAGLHTVQMRDGVMRMHALEAIEIHPGEPAVLRPGGSHVMLIGLKRRLSKGGSFPLTLHFERAGRLTVTVRILGPGARGMKHGTTRGKRNPTH